MKMKGIMLRDYVDACYATMVAEGIKTIETRKWAWKHYKEIKDLVFCCSQSSESKNAGLALCVNEVFHIEPMLKEHELEACCKVYPKAKSWFLRNLRKFDVPFETRGRITGSAQTIFDIEVPDDVKLIPIQTIPREIATVQTLFPND